MPFSVCCFHANTTTQRWGCRDRSVLKKINWFLRASAVFYAVRLFSYRELIGKTHRVIPTEKIYIYFWFVCYYTHRKRSIGGGTRPEYSLAFLPPLLLPLIVSFFWYYLRFIIFRVNYYYSTGRALHLLYEPSGLIYVYTRTHRVCVYGECVIIINCINTVEMPRRFVLKLKLHVPIRDRTG